MLKPKMDLGKALATMGFGTARLDDVHGKRDAQDELNNSLTRLMEAHEKKKKKLLETEKIELKRSQMADKLRDEVRTVHEAYQFLSRKYQIDKERLKEKEMEMQQQTIGEIVIEEEDDFLKKITAVLCILSCKIILEADFAAFLHIFITMTFVKMRSI